MAVGDKFVLTSRTSASTFPGFPAYNVFAYTNTLGNGNAAHLMGLFDTLVKPKIHAIMSNLSAITLLQCYNLDNVLDFGQLATTGAGGVAGDVLPPFSAWSFAYLRQDRTINDGSKRFGLIPESLWSGTALQSGAVTDVPTLVTQLAAVLAGGGIEYTPRIWRRAGFYGPLSTPFPDTFYAITGVQFKGVGSQNTRKR